MTTDGRRSTAARMTDALLADEPADESVPLPPRTTLACVREATRRYAHHARRGEWCAASRFAELLGELVDQLAADAWERGYEAGDVGDGKDEGEGAGADGA